MNGRPMPHDRRDTVKSFIDHRRAEIALQHAGRHSMKNCMHQRLDRDGSRPAGSRSVIGRQRAFTVEGTAGRQPQDEESRP